MRKPWTTKEVERAKEMLAGGMSRYEIDRYFDRPRNSTWQALALRENVAYRERQILLKRQWRVTNRDNASAAVLHLDRTIPRAAVRQEKE